MTNNTPSITETPDAFIVNGITVPKMKRGQLNLYDPALIKAVGADLFFQLVAPKSPFLISGFRKPNGTDDMEEQIRYS